MRRALGGLQWHLELLEAVHGDLLKLFQTGIGQFVWQSRLGSGLGGTGIGAGAWSAHLQIRGDRSLRGAYITCGAAWADLD